MSAHRHERVDVAFPSEGEECRAWLFRPDTERPPVVVLGHGLGGTRELGLAPYGERFAEAGIAALAFTYRHFGDSGGAPRQLLDIRRQLSDWSAALRYVRALPDVDGERVAIWGSSFGGGHAIETAARDGRVSAVVSQCPFMDGLASVRAANPRSLARCVLPAVRDEIRGLRGGSPVLVSLVGPPGTAALMTSPDSETGYRALIPADLAFRDRVSARILNRLATYRPGRAAARVRCPILFCVCDEDAVAPAATTVRYAATAPRAEVKRYPIGHFDIYQGAPFDIAVADQVAFLRRHLGLASD